MLNVHTSCRPRVEQQCQATRHDVRPANGRELVSQGRERSRFNPPLKRRMSFLGLCLFILRRVKDFRPVPSRFFLVLIKLILALNARFSRH